VVVVDSLFVRIGSAAPLSPDPVGAVRRRALACSSVATIRVNACSPPAPDDVGFCGPDCPCRRGRGLVGGRPPAGGVKETKVVPAGTACPVSTALWWLLRGRFC